MSAEMSGDAIPLEPEEREWLLERCAELIEAIGWQRFVQAPLVLPDERSFPDPWTADARGIRRAAGRSGAFSSGRLIAGTIDELYQRVDAEHRYELSRCAR